MPDAEGELQQLGAYTVERLLYEGRASSLYAGQKGRKSVVIRIIHRSFGRAETREQFLARAKQLKKLKHRSIIDIYDCGVQRLNDGQDECGYLIMQYVQGESLRRRITLGQCMAADEVKRILAPAASALHYAHVQQIIHANLHPGNLLFDAGNEPLLADFSLFLEVTSTEQNVSALPYMAPEQLRGAPVPASDQYALAVISYELLCGRRPYDATEPEQLLEQQEHMPLPAPHALNDAISPAVESVLLQALQPDPGERYPTIQEFADQYLRALMGFTATLSSSSGMRVISLPSAAQQPSLSGGRSAVKREAIIQKVEDATWPEERDESSEYFYEAEEEESRRSFVTGQQLLDTVIADLGEGGILSQRLPGYEERPAQIEMARVVAHALTYETKAVIEAATGVGKSLAYLLPIVRSGHVAIISTANKALQEQLYYKDIPFVQKQIKNVEAVLYKGMGNYVCLDRLETERGAGLQFYVKNREFTRLVELTQDNQAEFNGDFETLDFQLPADIRSHVAADSDQCAWKKCNYYKDCYIRKMRAKAERAQLIVVNHTLLLLDAAMDGYFLPERDVIIVDEAHHLEEEATRAFTITVSPNSIRSLLNQRMLKDHCPAGLQDEAEAAMSRAWEQLREAADPGFKGRANLLEPLEEGLKLATIIRDIASALIKYKPGFMTEKDENLYNKLVKRAQNLSENIRTVFSVADRARFVYYVERVTSGAQRSLQLQASAAPLDVTEWLRERIFNKGNVICTSATLATIGSSSAEGNEPGFAYFRRRVGLDPAIYPDIEERILPLTFDYESNALLYVPRDLPEPAYGAGSDEYIKALARKMYDLVKSSRGRAFLLFSSKRALDRAFELLAPHLDFPLLKQGDLSRIELTRRFREETGSVLFGLKSFWEGVDIAGEALSLVVIDKLPFDPPDDPVHEARVAQMKAAGENWFGTYVLPQAVLRLKQGLGRLLRTHDDRGVMAILDVRLYTKGYGRLVLDALPPARRTSDIRQVKRFFDEELDEL